MQVYPAPRSGLLFYKGEAMTNRLIRVTICKPVGLRLLSCARLELFDSLDDVQITLA
jgi:hypothetical protein